MMSLLALTPPVLIQSSLYSINPRKALAAFRRNQTCVKNQAKGHALRASAAPMEEDSFSATLDSQVDEAGRDLPPASP